MDKIKYKRQIVAFIDILGFRNLTMDKSKCADIADILKTPYMLREGDIPKMMHISNVMMTSISDSIVISLPNHKNALNKLSKLLSAFTRIFLLQYGLFLRGGIAIGDLFHDDQVVFGPGLVKAYELEHSQAIYPRIIIEESDMENLLASCTSSSRLANEMTLFRKDIDNKLYLDCFQYTDEKTRALYLQKLDEQPTSTYRIWEKQQWMRRCLLIKR